MYPSELNFLRNNKKMSVCTHQSPQALPYVELWRKENYSENHNGSQTSTFKRPVLLNGTLVFSALVLRQQSSTTIAFGMPMPKTPLSLLDTGHHMAESEAYMERLDSASWEENVQLYQKFIAV